MAGAIDDADVGLGEGSKNTLAAGLGARLRNGVPGGCGVWIGVLWFDIQMPSIWIPLSRALAPKGISSFVSIGNNSASSSFWRASAAAYRRIFHRV